MASRRDQSQEQLDQEAVAVVNLLDLEESPQLLVEVAIQEQPRHNRLLPIQSKEDQLELLVFHLDLQIRQSHLLKKLHHSMAVLDSRQPIWDGLRLPLAHPMATTYQKLLVGTS